MDDIFPFRETEATKQWFTVLGLQKVKVSFYGKTEGPGGQSQRELEIGCTIFIAVSAKCMLMNFLNCIIYICVCSGMFSAAGMGLWHGVEHWEMNKINVETNTELFVKSWPEVFFFF